MKSIKRKCVKIKILARKPLLLLQRTNFSKRREEERENDQFLILEILPGI
jgi:hypothetical protein